MPTSRVCGRMKTRPIQVVSSRNFPVIWSSKLQGDIATSTMKAEYSALSMAMRDLLPFRELLLALQPALGIDASPRISFKTTVHEDNAGALTLSNLEPSRITPRSKHYALKMHWFRRKLDPEGLHPIIIQKISTDLQRADIFTKGLSRVKFQYIRKLLCSW
jgi:hypothetical protein